MKKRKIAAAILAAVTAFSMVACSEGASSSSAITEVNVNMEKYNSSKAFRTFIDVPPGVSESKLEPYKALGFNGYIMTEDESAFTDRNGKMTEQYSNALKLLNQLDLDIYVRNQYNDPDYFSNDDDTTIRQGYTPYTIPKRDITTEFDAFDGIAGFYMADEPNYNKLSTFQKLIDWQNNYAADKFFHMNLFPSYASAATFAEHTYTEYVQQYIDAVISKVNSPKSLCLDNYPLIRGIDGNTIRGSYLLDLIITATHAKNYNDTPGITSKAEYGICIQSFYDAGLRDIVCSGDITFQLAMGMAMGANVFEYFLYGSGDGMYGITQSGQPRIYDYVKEANDKMLTMDKVLNCFEWQGIVTVPAAAEKDRLCADSFDMVSDFVLKDMGSLSAVTARLDTVIGVFDHADGENGYMVVNYSEPSAGKVDYVNLEFSGKTKAIVYRNGVGKGYALTGGKLQLKLESGEGAFVIAL